VWVLAALVLLIGVTGHLHQFTGPDNLGNLARSVSLQSIFAVGELLVILTGGIDLSVGSLIAFDGMLLAVSMGALADHGMAPLPATLIGIGLVLLFSLALGLVHALFVHFLRLPSF